MQTQSRLSYFQLSIFHTLHSGPHFLDQYFLIFFFDRNQIRKPSLPKLKGSKTHLLLLQLNQISPLIYLLTIGRCDCHLLIMIQAIIVLLFYKHRIGTMYIVSFTICFIDLNFNLFAFQSYLLICFKCVCLAVTLLVRVRQSLVYEIKKTFSTNQRGIDAKCFIA